MLAEVFRFVISWIGDACIRSLITVECDLVFYERVPRPARPVHDLAEVSGVVQRYELFTRHGFFVCGGFSDPCVIRPW